MQKPVLNESFALLENRCSLQNIFRLENMYMFCRNMFLELIYPVIIFNKAQDVSQKLDLILMSKIYKPTMRQNG